MSRIQFQHSYDDIISLENLLEGWKEFIKGKRGRKDVQEFERNLMENIISLHHDLATWTYRHSHYHYFKISDPKPRDIHKASVRDRLLHHALHRKLYPFFNRTFISDSTSCRLEKGTHVALKRFTSFTYKVSKNYTRQSWILKCDIRKFFASIDHDILIDILNMYIPDKDILSLIAVIIKSFSSISPSVGLPLGNLTSQLLVNVYMNEFDRFVKHSLKEKFYIRYADDFVIFSEDKKQIGNILDEIKNFLWQRLRLKLHPNKISIRTVSSGNDYLGWVHFPDHTILRTYTKKRMLKRLKNRAENPQTVQSYLGLLKHGNGKILQNKIRKYPS